MVAKKKLSALLERDLPHTEKSCVWPQSSYFGAIQSGVQRETPPGMNTGVLSADTYPPWTRMDINELQLIKTYQNQIFAGSVDNQTCYFTATPEGQIRWSLLHMKHFSWGRLVFHKKANPRGRRMLFIIYASICHFTSRRKKPAHSTACGLADLWMMCLLCK